MTYESCPLQRRPSEVSVEKDFWAGMAGGVVSRPLTPLIPLLTISLQSADGKRENQSKKGKLPGGEDIKKFENYIHKIEIWQIAIHSNLYKE